MTKVLYKLFDKLLYQIILARNYVKGKFEMYN